jgi:branched-chain amino acid transport system ATP-binding protein
MSLYRIGIRIAPVSDGPNKRGALEPEENGEGATELLQGQGITKSFGKLIALDGVDFFLRKGETLGMVGPNGSGKTTLFNILSGIYPPTAGAVFYKGNKIVGESSHALCQRGIARTFQVVQPFTRMTLLENVMVGALYGNGQDLAGARRKGEEILQFVGLKEKIHLFPDSLTTADRRRLELGRALATHPEVLLLDETMAGLTPAEIEEAIVLLKNIRDQGVTLFLVEHIMKVVMSLCTRIIVLDYGQKIAEGTPDEVLKNPQVIKAYLGDRYV